MRESGYQLSWWPVAIALAVASVPGPVWAAAGAEGTVSGSATAIDGDTLDVGGRRVRMEGIDAPEHDQVCGTPQAGSWACGREAWRALASLIGGRTVECESRGRDKYDRMLGICRVEGRDLNDEMVRRGLAWAFVKYSNSYVETERVARASGVGVWQGKAQPAWEFRAARWASAQQQAPNGCAIKGNVTDKGHIYHAPWSPWYGRVKVEPAKGERWFCSEGEALAAGWRPALVN